MGRNRTRKPTKDPQPERLEVVHRRAAGIDIGSRSHFVAVSPALCEQSVREFSALTPGLIELVQWLQSCGVQSVVMESTGIYWLPLYEMLESAGIEVWLVNAQHVRTVPGRKSDVLDCQWLLKLHTFGMLRGSFRPNAEIVELRSYLRQRDTLVNDAAREVHHMQKAMTMMNLQLHTVISDITGTTGLKIIRAILAGERDASRLASMRDARCHASEKTICDSLTGTYLPEHLFVLDQSLRLYDTYQELIQQCDQKASALLSKLAPAGDEPPQLPKTRRPGSKQPSVDYRTPAYQLAGTDLTAIPGISAYTAITLLAEIGTDMTHWSSEKHFAAWLRLAPGSKISGGKSLSSRTLPTTSRAHKLLRMAAVNAGRTRTAIGAFYRRTALRRGTGRAVVATAHKLARIIFHMLRTKRPYEETGQEAYEQRCRDRVLRNLKKQADSMGLKLIAVQPDQTEGCAVS